MKSQLNFLNREITVTVITNDKRWGKGLNLDCQFNDMDCKVDFNCHLEFKSFDKYNNLSHKELFEIAVGQLNAGWHNKAIPDVSNQGLRILRVLIGTNLT